MAGLTIAKNKYEDYTADGNDAIHFKLVRTEEELYDDSIVFHPEMTHQVFGETENVFGYKDLKINIFFTAAKMQPYVGIKFSDKITNGTVSADDIVKLLDERLSPGYSTNLDDFGMTVTKDVNFIPHGCMIHSYTVSKDVNDRQFEIYKCDIETKGFREFHARIQPLLIFFVDAASYIDVDDDRWIYYTIFEKYRLSEGGYAYAFVGYMTAYNYYAYPEKIRPRISQVLILPPFQRQGHGATVIETFYNECLKRKDILDITVEDPSEGFQRVRDFVDARNCFSLPSFQKEKLVEGFKEEMYKEAREQLKINKKQARRVYEILRLHHTNVNDAKEMKAYRLDVKKRLNAPFQKNGRDQSKIERMLTPDEMAATSLSEMSTVQRLDYLDKAFKESVEEYTKVLNRLSM